MKIRKHGRLFTGTEPKEKIEKFKCDNCNCEFSVKDDEYYRHAGGGSYNWTVTGNLTWTYPTKDLLICSCPECYRICRKTVNGVNDFISPLVSGTTYTSKTAETDTINITCSNDSDNYY